MKIAGTKLVKELEANGFIPHLLKYNVFSGSLTLNVAFEDERDILVVSRVVTLSGIVYRYDASHWGEFVTHTESGEVETVDEILDVAHRLGDKIF